jgi:hypothetical protein
MGFILGVAVLVLAVYVIHDLVKSGKDLEKKALWGTVIVLLPAVGMVMYFLVGRKPGRSGL